MECLARNEVLAAYRLNSMLWVRCSAMAYRQCRSIASCLPFEAHSSDWELVDEQFSPPQSGPPLNGIMIAVLVGIFILGPTTGSLLFAPGSTPAQATGDWMAFTILTLH
jgi:hypothetical protein